MKPTATQDPPLPPTAHGRRRRELIIDAAEGLFQARGFHATGIDDIGAVAGIRGPSIYRHFASKEDILIAILDRVWRIVRTGIEEADGLEPQQALDVLIDGHLRLALEHPGGIVVLVRELRHTSEAYRQLAEVNDARTVEAWAQQLVRLRPPLSLDEARVATRALHALVISLAANPVDLLDDEAKRSMIRAMVHGSISAL